MLNALVVGYGSAGKRHLRNLLRLECIGGVAVCTGMPGAESDPRVRFISSLGEAESRGSIENGFDFAIVANETGRHMETAIELAGRGIDLLIEKPLSNSLDGVEVLEDAVRQRGLKVGVAYNFRFLGALGRVKEELRKKTIGEALFARIEAGQYLPAWRPGRDYRRSYSASRARGGGVTLDLSHEIDYMRYLFGEPVEWKVMRSKAGSLDIDSEDVFEGVYRFTNGFVCSVHLDYLRSEKRRMISITGSNGAIECDLAGARLRAVREGRSEDMGTPAIFDLEQSYMDELVHFIGSVDNGRNPGPGLEDGIAALRLIEDSHVHG